MNQKIPTISICNLLGEDYSIQDIMVYDLQAFLNAHQDIVFPHRHSFFQILLIQHGNGIHIIDFEQFELTKNQVYFLAPGQIHEWKFENNVQGILINFNENLLSSFLANSKFLADFQFFTPNGLHSLVDLSLFENQNKILKLLDDIKQEFESCNECKLDLLRVLLLNFLILINRNLVSQTNSTYNKLNFTVFHNFEKLLEQHFSHLKLPKEYAEILFVTPNHLNAICKQISGKSAGELIRNRILLEAKRLLVNSKEHINEIAFYLNFNDNSYFSRFFKKYEGISPEDFRKIKLDK